MIEILMYCLKGPIVHNIDPSCKISCHSHVTLSRNTACDFTENRLGHRLSFKTYRNFTNFTKHLRVPLSLHQNEIPEAVDPNAIPYSRVLKNKLFRYFRKTFHKKCDFVTVKDKIQDTLVGDYISTPWSQNRH